MQMRNVMRIPRLRKRTKVIEVLKQSVKPVVAHISDMQVKRHFAVDLSLGSMLGGVSGIYWDRRVSFIVTTEDGKTYVSDATNVPVSLAPDHVASHAQVQVYATETDSYVELDSLPAFDPMDAISKVFDKG